MKGSAGVPAANILARLPAEAGRPDFRSDINGLRAIAVTAVFLFHFGVTPFDGGFVGVDVFFVISGFLMTSIITRAADGSRFSLVDFYIARLKRILPALIVVALATIASGVVLTLPPALMALRNDALKACLFVANLAFAATTTISRHARSELVPALLVASGRDPVLHRCRIHTLAGRNGSRWSEVGPSVV